MRHFALLVCLGACGFRAGVKPDPDAPPSAPDVPVLLDAPTDVPGGCTTSFSSLINTCGVAAGGPISLTDPANCYDYNTDTHALGYFKCDDNGTHFTLPSPTFHSQSGIDFVLVSAFNLGAGTSLVVTGASPFAVVSPGSVTVAGDLRVLAGRRTGAQCMTSAGLNGLPSGSGGGGGGGGGFGEAGKLGGNGQANGGGGGAAAALPTSLVGGCPGGIGGQGSSGTPAAGGSGGGAFYMAGISMITVSGTINVGGRGGNGGSGNSNNAGTGYRCGGGGGGSGGMIWLESPMLAVTGVVAANGGGGGEGSGNAQPGADGENGRTSAMRALGGNGNDPTGGDGGAGGTVAMAPSPGTSSTDGGGGGGGGFIKLTGTRSGGGVVSPTPF